MEEIKKQFSAPGATQFGSGWAWLVVDNGNLAIAKTPNAENPITSGKTPILTMDVWEHAYYLGKRRRCVACAVNQPHHHLAGDVAGPKPAKRLRSIKVRCRAAM